MRLATPKQMDQAGDVHERGNKQTVEPSARRSDRWTLEYLHYSVFVRVIHERACTVFAKGDHCKGAVKME